MDGLDLFSGIGGNSIGLGGYITAIAYCECERFCQSVLLQRMATGEIDDAPIWDDIRTLDGFKLPYIDIIYGGFPCQDISVAGRGAGLAGERSGLFYEILRLIDETKAPFIFLENVPAIRTRGAETVCKELAKRGYDCRWCAISAASVGAPHKRERWFLLAYSAGKQDRGLQFQRIQSDTRGKSSTVSDSSSLRCDEGARKRVQPKGTAEQHEKSSDSSCKGSRQQSTRWLAEPNVGRVADGIPLRMDRLKALGNAVVPEQAKKAFEILMFGRK